MKSETDKVLKYEERNLALSQAAGDRSREAMTLVNLASAYRNKGLPELFRYYMLQAYTIYNEDNDLHGIFFTSMVLGDFLCSDPGQLYLEEGIWLLEQAYEIGLQSDEYADVTIVGDTIKRYQPLLAKKIKLQAKQKKADKKSAVTKKQAAENKQYTGMKIVWRGK